MANDFTARVAGISVRILYFSNLEESVKALL